MQTAVHGIHHVTCIAGDPQENLTFYLGVMGMRLVKKTVNQDDPHTYHLYYADRLGTPGTNLTFFPWPHMAPGRNGIGLTVEVPFVIPRRSLNYWQERLARAGVQCRAIEVHFGETIVPFRDPHGLQLALVATDTAQAFVPWEKSPVPAEHQLRGVHSVRLWERELGPTATLLTDSLGFVAAGEEDGWQRYVVEGGGPGKIIDVKELPHERRGVWGPGAVHHVAWRMQDSDEEMQLRDTVEQTGLRVTPQIDRFWFLSVYFKEPGGALFELATDGPGFDRDEPQDHLGERLILPPWLEAERAKIEAALLPLDLERAVLADT